MLRALRGRMFSASRLSMTRKLGAEPTRPSVLSAADVGGVLSTSSVSHGSADGVVFQSFRVSITQTLRCQ